MIQSKKKSSRSGGRLGSLRRVLKMTIDAPIIKCLNGSISGSKNATWLVLEPTEYSYDGLEEDQETKSKRKTQKTKTAKTYQLKGIRGCVRHSVMGVCYERELNVCHTSDKGRDSKGNSLLPNGFHLTGECVKNGGECIIHSIFGSKGHEGKISVSVAPIAFIKETRNLELTRPVQIMHIATENRHCRTFDGKVAQDFTEKYASGRFTCEADVTLLNQPELGLVIEAIMRMERLGRGFNAGYGRIAVTKFQLVKRQKEKKRRLVNGWFELSEEITEESLNGEVEAALQAWEDYVSAITG